jgi:RNA polymerase sigma-70 factor (ECF subfamily)
MTTARAEQARWFTTTHWSIVLDAADTSAPGAQEALEKLCRTYWYPLYAYVRRQGHSPEDAQDLTQEFFARFLDKKYFRFASPERGRFRTFLLSSLKNFLINEWERARVAKRGGGAIHIPLDGLAAEDHFSREPVHEITAEKIYERNWAIAVLKQVRARLQQEYATSGRADRFAQLEAFLPGQESDLTYAEAARRLGVAEGTLKSDVNRFKKRYRELLRAEVAHTVSSRAELDEELRHLIEVLGGS